MPVYCPSVKTGWSEGDSASRWNSVDGDPPNSTPVPVKVVARNATTLVASNTWVTTGRLRTAPPNAAVGCRTVAAPSWTHAGHWNPTEAPTMQSGQIGRSHRVQAM